MAGELSQEALLDFLCQAGGRVRNAELLSHFKGFLRDPHVPPGQLQQRRELFKGFVNSVAAVRQDPDGTKYVVLKRRYRDLLGEEGLQRPTPAERPQPGRHRPRDPEAQKPPPAGAAPRVDSGGDELAGSSAREAAGAEHGPRDSPSRGTPGPAAAQTRGRCAAAETRGRCCWECQQNGWGDPTGQHLPGDLEDPAAASEEPELVAATAPDGLGAPGWLREGASAERAPVCATPDWPPAAIEAAGSPTSPPALLPLPAPSSEPLELFTAGSPTHPTQQLQQQQQQQQRTREWVSRCPQMPEAGNPGPTRAWSVVPDDFLQLPLETAFGVSETNSGLPEPAVSLHSLLPVVPDESSESWPGNLPPTVFRSIRCQLSLQDLDDFVDQESHGSEESSSGPKESPGTPEEGQQPVLGTSSWGELRDPIEGLSVSSNDSSPRRIRRSLRIKGNVPNSRKVSTVAKSLGDHPQEASPWPAPKFRRSLRRSARAGGTKSSSSSDEEHLDEDLLKRSRRPPRSRKPSKAGTMPSPRVDMVLIQNLADANVVAGQPHTSWAPNRDGSAALTPHRLSEHRSPLVPLDAREHEWIVRLASGSWLHVQTLFWEDPQLALHRDFLTGFTALHWLAKHGDLRALQDLISGAQKAGVALDVNVRSSCGYTPLHLAAIHGHQGVIKLLVQRLASRVNVRDYNGKKPWQYLNSNATGETWQLLGAPRGKPIFPVYPLVQSSSPARKVKSREMSRNVTRKSSLAALLKTQHNKWKLASQYEKFHTPKEKEEYSD
ncbi:ankyrin repeat domain-containing protein SOWAHB [Peromyscus californicus insignis]|uniref:ankyrin repeat domain-containing protein SOWAHB n=1 Tax=Peromyscus californicus insignis TaxID=564181 RepID=UPI0022A76A36|nr:ankyrin repeat domain-containing protein SOWAHB [Peromyscus californicus insignis]